MLRRMAGLGSTMWKALASVGARQQGALPITLTASPTLAQCIVDIRRSQLARGGATPLVW